PAADHPDRHTRARAGRPQGRCTGLARGGQASLMGVFELVNVALFAVVVVTAFVISHLRALYGAVMLAALLSLVSATLFVLLDAVDVAFTEAAVGAGISTVLFLTVLAVTRSREAVTPRRRIWPAALAAVFTGGTLLYAS